MLQKLLLASIFVYAFAANAQLPSPKTVDYFGMVGASQNAGIASTMASEHIDVAKGAVHLSYTDMVIPGNGGFDLKIKRFYDTARVNGRSNKLYTNEPINFYAGLQGWRMGFGAATVVAESDLTCSKPSKTRLYLELPDGGSADVTLLSTGVHYASNLWRITPSATAFTNGSGSITLTDLKGTKYEMIATGYSIPYTRMNGGCYSYRYVTKKITDTNGNYATINYRNFSGSEEVESIATNDGRTVQYAYTDYGYGDSSTITVSSDGQSIVYRRKLMDEKPFTDIFDSRFELYRMKYSVLEQVVNQGGETTNYQYGGYYLKNSNGALTTSLNPYWGQLSKVTDSTGGIHEYSYKQEEFEPSFFNPYNGMMQKPQVALAKKTITDSTTGASPLVWTYSYGFESTPVDFQTRSVTQVQSPVGFAIYYHNRFGILTTGGSAVINGVNTAYMYGEAHLYGTLSQVKTYGLTSNLISDEKYTYGKVKFSDGVRILRILGSDLWDSAFFIPALATRVVLRDGAMYTTAFANYDIYGNPAIVTESGPNGGNRTTTKTYYNDTSRWIIGKPQSEAFTGSSTSRTYFPSGNLQSHTHNGVTTSYTYDAQGNRASTTFPRGLTHTYSDYHRGTPKMETQPEGIAITRTVNDSGTIASETNGEGNTTRFNYDGLSRITLVTPPIGSPITIAYTPTSKTAKRGALTEITLYDGLSRVKGISLGGISRVFSYDALGRKTFESNPNEPKGMTYAYDAIGRLTRKTNPDDSYSIMTYGPGMRTVTNELGYATTTAYRSYGNPDEQYAMAITAPAPAASVVMTRNSLDQLTSAVQGGVTRSYTYDTRSFLETVTDPETGVITYARDDANNVKTRTIGGLQTTFDYDGQNRLTLATYPTVNGISTPFVTKTYYKTHKLKTVSSSATTRAYVYSANDKLTGESLVVDGNTFATGYGYNANDQLASITYPSIAGETARSVVYNPDELGRPTIASEFITGVDYFPSGQIKQLSYGNGQITTYGQNNSLWPNSFTTAKAGVLVINNGYGYDGTGNLLSVVDTVDGNNRTFTFDAINRVATASGAWGNGLITYDGAGNIKTQSLGAKYLGYNYDNSNRLTSTNGDKAATYIYDTQGNITSDTAVAGTTGTSSYAYDGANNLRCINCASTNQTALPTTEYGYDGLNQRVWSLKRIGNTPLKTYEIYSSNGQLLTEFTPSLGNKIVEHIYLGTKRIAQKTISSVSGVTSGGGGTGGTTGGTSGAQPVATTSSLTATNTTIWPNQTVTFTATVSGNNPSGTVIFTDGTTVLSTATLVAGQASITQTYPSIGTYAVAFSYNGDTNNLANSSNAIVVIVRTPNAKQVKELLTILEDDDDLPKP